MLTITELFLMMKKYLLPAAAAAFLGAVATYLGVLLVRDYTCTLTFQYNYEGAEENLAPDGAGTLDPYQMQNPAVIHSALDRMGISTDGSDIQVEDIRNNISISKVYTSQDQEVAEAAAVLGENYALKTSEYRLTYTYPALLGENYGKLICNGLINAYDDFFIENYYDKDVIPDFMQNIARSNVDYLDLASVIKKNFDDVIATLNDYAAAYPNYRSSRTGYSFAELAELYQNAENDLYAQLEGNIRAGNLARDPELVVKNYTTTVRSLLISEETYNEIAESYKTQIKTFYDSYKATGLYNQAAGTQVTQNSSNNRDQNVLRDYEHDFETLINTYDSIVLSYTQQAALASEARLDRTYYLNIIQALQTDQVAQDTKTRLVEKNEALLQTMTEITGRYCGWANESIDELFDQIVAEDIQYLISANVTSDISIPFALAFAAVVMGAMVMLAGMVREVLLKNNPELAASGEPESETAQPRDREHAAAYEQYKQGFPEFFLVYQEMQAGIRAGAPRYEAYVRWNSAQLGPVSVRQMFRYFGDLNLMMELNDWIVETVCRDIRRFEAELGVAPVIHINCMFSEVADFGMTDILHKNSQASGVAASCLCVEMDGRDIMSCVREMMLMQKMGYPVCVDHFEDKAQAEEILAIFRPDYVKVSGKIFRADGAAPDGAGLQNRRDILDYLKSTIRSCHENGIGFCISGIENQEEDLLIYSLDIDYKQGYYYGYPAAMDDLLKELRETTE